MKGLRGLIVLGVALLFGCAEHRTLEELELAALQSGDWSAVEKRERAIERRKARQGPSCGAGLIAYCEGSGRHARCQCTSQEAVERALGDW